MFGTGSSPLTRGKLLPPGHLDCAGRLIPAHAGKTAPSTSSPWAGWAHPRSRGENAGGAGEHVAGAGSSPLTRGKQRCASVPPCRPGLIPAHAGKTCEGVEACGGVGAHPRSRGENLGDEDPGVFEVGSSPLTRGKLLSHDRFVLARGLIPAHAGKTTSAYDGGSRRRAHPRSRGENLAVRDRVFRVTGSSPLTRGKPTGRRESSCTRGLIPAHAGKTNRPGETLSSSRAHPRSRGENVRVKFECHVGNGSSPLTRGKRSQLIRALQAHGLIPAHAGKTPGSSKARQLSRAHPRSRGENRLHIVRPLSSVGSSPLTRGKLDFNEADVIGFGLIPAHAGKTTSLLEGTPNVGAHPRSRGENPFAARGAEPVMGSSPLTRGKRAGKTRRSI